MKIIDLLIVVLGYIEDNDRACVSPAGDHIPIPPHRKPNYKENPTDDTLLTYDETEVT